MKPLTLALRTLAIGLATTATALYAQGPSPATKPSQPRPGYSLYGGPQETSPQTHGVQSPSTSPLYKMYGVPDDITNADKSREARRNAAVEFGMFRASFPASSRFWIDHDRTQLAHARYSMDEEMFRSIHPDYDWGDGGYLYNTAAAVRRPQLPGNEHITAAPPIPYTAPSSMSVTRTTPKEIVNPNVPAIDPNQAVDQTTPLVASE